MSGREILFYILGAVTVASAVGVITRRSAVHSAVLLIAALMGVAGIYVVLEAEFLAAVQVLVYAGGVMVLFLFVIMLVDLDKRGRPSHAPTRAPRGLAAAGALVALLLVLTLLSIFLQQSFSAPPATADMLRADGGNLGAVAMVMFQEYLLPFELASVLLLVAMVGAVVLARFRT
jgi:NADH-quinone oxidoreductase subunit J